MWLDKEKLELVISGYTREISIKYRFLFPKNLNKICFDYHGLASWDKTEKYKDEFLTYNKNIIKVTKKPKESRDYYTSWGTAFIDTIIDSGIHKYSFEIINNSCDDWSQDRMDSNFIFGLVSIKNIDTVLTHHFIDYYSDRCFLASQVALILQTIDLVFNTKKLTSLTLKKIDTKVSQDMILNISC